MAKKNDSYSEEQKLKNIEHLRKLLNDLPPFLENFFRASALTKTPKTLVAYAYDLRIFFNYLLTTHENFKSRNVRTLTAEDLSKLTSTDLEKYLEYLNYYIYEKNNGVFVEHQNGDRGKARKFSTVRTLYKYLFKKNILFSNPAELVDLPKIRDKNIVRLDYNEISNLLDLVENGEKLSERQKRYHQYTKTRDLAILMLLLGTGIRVSECVGINISDIDFERNAFKITRKGGNETILYFPDEVKEALTDYFIQRKNSIAVNGSEQAFFLSMQNSRLTARSIQNLVGKYSDLMATLKKISPHKLRSTFGTNLYRATGDIYLVADVLGHKDVNTTKRHYAQVDDDRRREAAKYVKLRIKD